MSILCVFHPSSPALPNKLLTHHDDIAATLAEQGVRFAHNPLELRVRPGTSQEQVLDTCREYLDQLMTVQGSKAFTVLNRDGAEASPIDLRDEHVHDAEEVLAVVAGRVQVGLRLGDYVYAVMCEKGDQLVIPAGSRRWMELGDNPFCVALRLFANEQGAQAKLTGDDSARLYAGIDEF